ncbi:glycosyltransferase family A protein [Dryocola clanedunensis]|uniref:glycosyltransferase family A protein n=1 Tax=Cedecea sulfonylureivorans TaxID=3051154 RepID=UPI00192894D1|nr:glycosyltransferase family 2 protein [Cedecea sulfonylureivorans]
MFSIIITVFNREQSIAAAIESCLIQSYKEYEIIIIDDGSVDNSYKVIEPYLKNNKVRYYYQTNQGAAAAKNKGADKAKFPYILFLDSDDVISDPSVFNTIACEITSSHPDFISFKKIMIRISGQISIQEDKNLSNSIDFRRHMLEAPLNYAGKPPYLFNKQCFLQCNGFDVNSKWGDALIFWRRFFDFNIKSKVIDDVGYIYDQTDTNSISRNKNIALYAKALAVIRKCYEENKNSIFEIKAEKNWQLIFVYYAIKSKSANCILKAISELLSGRLYLLPRSLLYIVRTKVLQC